jgi:murein DD-endopeptidase MepM/ murein hydrolase activator NlpD
MHKRKLLIGLTTAALFLTGFGAATMPASAEQHTLLVTLASGAQITVNVDVEPGTPVDQIPIPGVAPEEIAGVTDVTPAPAPAPEPDPGTQTSPAPQEPTTTTGTTPAPKPSPSPTPAPHAQSQPQPQAQSHPQSSGSAGTTSSSPSSSSPSSSPAAGTPQAARQAQQSVKRKRTRKAQAPVPTADKPAKAKNARRGRRGGNDATASHRSGAGTATHETRTPPVASRKPDGVPTPANPTFSQALPGPAPIGVPNFFIDRFRIPPFLLPIYQAAGIEYGVRWEILAAINEIETDYGRNLNVSSAGALGWMQFMPATWKTWGVDGNHDGRRDPYNPVDAIFSAARYLAAARIDQDVRGAIFAYNHADWYVDSVLMRARLISGLPADLVGSLTGLTQGRFPVHATARYADDISERDAKRRVAQGANAALPVQGSTNRRGLNIYAKAGSPIIAVQDGKIVRMGVSRRLGRFIKLRDVYGNTYTYAHLASLSTFYPVPKKHNVSKGQIQHELELPQRDPLPTAPATAGQQVDAQATADDAAGGAPKAAPALVAPLVKVRKERLFANPLRPKAFAAGGQQQLLNAGSAIPGFTTFKDYFTGVFGLKRSEVQLERLRRGSKVIAGTILGRIGVTDQTVAPHVLFEIRPAGRGAPRIDPKPILDGWKLLESTAVYRAAGKNPFFGPDARNPSIGQLLLMSKDALQRRVLSDPNVQIYDCGRQDIEAGAIDRRVLATLEFLSASGLKPTVSALKCGHSYLTSSGNVSEHSSGNAVDIAAINGVPILNHQGAGSITDITIRRLLTLQGTMKPHQIISLMTFQGADNTMSLPDHADHIHVGFHPLFGDNLKLGRQLNSVLDPRQWTRLIDRIGEIDNPVVPINPSRYALKVPTRGATSGHSPSRD